MLDSIFRYFLLQNPICQPKNGSYSVFQHSFIFDTCRHILKWSDYPLWHFEDTLKTGQYGNFKSIFDCGTWISTPNLVYMPNFVNIPADDFFSSKIRRVPPLELIALLTSYKVTQCEGVQRLYFGNIDTEFMK